MKSRFLIFFIAFINLAASLIAQSYVWPTDASYYISSSFSEFRNGHFHAGIDIKTWGKTGYPVYAVRSGHIWRIKVSPYGYGRVLYQKLDTGEIVVYAHLEKFCEQLEAVAKAEQQRKQEFSINKYFNPNEFPVEQGEIVAYTGESGIGPPHLHFEMRDQYNRPINPLLKGFPVKDTIPPQVSKFAVIPLRAATEINGDYQPQLITPIAIGSGNYVIRDIIQISGEVGFAVSAYDPINFVHNQLGVNQIRLYIDEKLVYAAKYDKFSYSYTNQIYLDRDFRLMERGCGIFYRCFRDYPNELGFYGQFHPGAGIINEKILSSQNSFFADSLVLTQSNSNHSHSGETANAVNRRLHEFRIEIADFYDNQCQVKGKLIYQKRPVLEPELETDAQNQVYLNNLSVANRNNLQTLSAYHSCNNGRTWIPIFVGRRLNTFFTGNDNEAAFRPQYLIKISSAQTGSHILKINGFDQYGHEYRPFFKILKYPTNITSQDAYFQIEKDFVDNYLNFQIHVSTPVMTPPRLTVTQEGSLPTQVPLVQRDLLDYLACCRLQPDKDGIARIEIEAVSLDNRGMYHEELFPVFTVPQNIGKEITTSNNCCRVTFPAAGVFETLFCRIYTAPPKESREYSFLGQIYQIEPSDVPLKKNAEISICYPADTVQPEKLGIYTPNSRGSQWYFSGNAHDPKTRKISTKVASLNKYVLIRDDVPPEVNLIYPANGIRLTNARPKIRVKINDALSGVPGDSQYMRLLLDNQRLIAEYDPERKELIYQPGEALEKGLHELIVAVRDRCGNAVEKKFNFNIL